MLFILSSLSGVPATTPSPCRDISKELTNENKNKILSENGSNEALVECFDTSKVTNMDTFLMGRDINADLNSWDVSSVTSMGRMFAYASAFNNNISSWDVSSVMDMGAMFYQASAFNNNISSWDVSSVTDMTRLFLKTSVFNGDISSWDVSAVDTMTAMFHKALVFNNNIFS